MNRIMLRVIPLGVFVHLVLIYGVIDINFTSPVLHNLPHHKSLSNPPAKRVVVIVADGLRAESIYRRIHEKRMPYLKAIRRTRGAWGISHTRVPTESRPGHVALMAGMYEDPSAMFKGWKHNPVIFDSVVNQSANAYCFGSPDNIHLFNRDKSSHIHEYAYSSDMQDFGKKRTELLDEWVFKTIHHLFKNHTLNCGHLCDSGNVFLLNLLGLDTAGHSYKPNSKEHIRNMLFVDDGIEALETLFQSFFRDFDTAYIFTADHGMTDWGSHGDGSPLETETPFIVWGAGINFTNKGNDINQADVAPLISALIGINYPINSMGVLPYQYLQLSEDVIAKARINNVKQLYEIYEKRDQVASTAFLYTPYHISDIDKALRRLETNFERENFQRVIKDSGVLAEIILDGLDYLNAYSSRPIYICLSFGMIFWIFYLSMCIVQRDRTIRFQYIYVPFKCEYILRLIIFLGTFVPCAILFELPLTFTSCIYIAFPIVILLFIFEDVKHLAYMCRLLCRQNSLHNLKYMIGALIIIELFVFGFHFRYLFSIFAIILGVWPLTVVRFNVEERTRFHWMLACFALGLFPALPIMQTSFNFYAFIFNIVMWMGVLNYQFIPERIAPDDQMPMAAFSVILNNQYILYILTTCNTFLIAVLYVYEMTTPLICNIISWVSLGWALLNIFISPPFIMFRIVNITISLMTIYTTFMFNYEGPFFFILLYVCYIWLSCEIFQMSNEPGVRMLLRTRYDMLLRYDHRERVEYNVDDYRRAIFYLGLILLSFFGTGNIASLNSFDPMWVRNYVTLFRPFTMLILIVIKITIPMLIITCVFRTINIYSAIPISNIFSMVLLFCDIMLFNFIFLIQNTGSWLDIGSSFSHFIVMNVIAIILMVFYYISYVFTTSTLHERYIKLLETLPYNIHED